MNLPRVKDVTHGNQTEQQHSWSQNKTNLITKELGGVRLILKEKIDQKKDNANMGPPYQIK
jgi:hypothetical protein